MRDIITTVYKFNELSEEAQQKALEKLSYINVDFDWWNNVYAYAENIGVKIEGFDLDRGSYCKIKCLNLVSSIINAIIRDHGVMCETYKTAMKHKTIVNDANLEYDADYEGDPEISYNMEQAEKAFLHDLSEDYRIMLQREYEYLTSKDAIIETIEANEYEFTIEGKLS